MFHTNGSMNANAAAVATGMWFSDQHWMSDILSGALIGGAIGRSGGLAFRSDPVKADETAMTIAPDTGRNFYGLQALARL